MKGYSQAGASYIKKALKGFIASSGSPQEDIDFNSYTLRQRSRILYMAAPIATSAIKTNRTNVIGIGLKLKSSIDREVLGMSPKQAEEWQKKTEREFALWANDKKNCDATGVNNFYGMQQLAFISWLLSGDCFGVFKRYPVTDLKPYSLRVHIVEADRISTPSIYDGVSVNLTTGKNRDTNNTIYDGVEIDKQGAIVAYHIRNNYPYSYEVETEWQRILAYGEKTNLPNIIHVMDSERPDQYRGVPYLAQVIEPMLQIRRYTESELIASIVESFFTAFIKTESELGINPLNEVDEKISTKPNEYEMGPGQVNMLKPGESVEFGDPKRPGSGFDSFTKNIAMQIGAALEIPSDLLLKSFTKSYSASRAALLEAWKAFRTRRVWFADDFCRPTYEVWLSEAIARGRITAPGFFSDPIIRNAYLKSDWIGPSQGQLDPVKEITAEILACSEGFSTHEQSTIRLNGGSWSDNIDNLKRENEKISSSTKSNQSVTNESIFINEIIKNCIKESSRGDETLE